MHNLESAEPRILAGCQKSAVNVSTDMQLYSCVVLYVLTVLLTYGQVGSKGIVHP